MSLLHAQSVRGEVGGDRLMPHLRMVTLAWVFGSVWVWAINGAAMTQFGRGLGMEDKHFGYLTALPFIGTLFQLPASYLLERYGQRKIVFLVLATLSRLLWSVAAAVPWLLPRTVTLHGAEHNLWWPTMLALLALSWILASASGPAWMNWMSDLIPRRVRGRYFALRNNVGNSIGLVVTLGIGYALDVTDRAGAASDGALAASQLMLRVTSAILAVAGLFGTLDILCFRTVADPPQPRPRQSVRLLDMVRGPLGDANFRRYLAFIFTFTFGTAFMGQYVWLYMFDVLHWTNQQANFLIVAMPLLLRLFVYGPWGRLTDRLGKKPVILISGFITMFGAVGWLLCTRENWWLGYILVMGVVVAWPGFEIATFNFILDLAGTRQDRANPAATHGGSAYVAMNSLTVAIAGVLSGLFAWAVAGWLKHWTWAPGVLGIVVTYHGLLFLISTALRAVSVIIAMTLHEPHATRTREAIRITAGEFYSNVQRMRMMPVQLAGQVMRWTYRVGNGRENKSDRTRTRTSYSSS